MKTVETVMSVTIMTITFIVCLPGALVSASRDLAFDIFNNWYGGSEFF